MEVKIKEEIYKIKESIDRLVALIDGAPSEQLIVRPSAGKKKKETPKGAVGALKTLTEEGYFDTPKSLANVIQRTQEIGHYYSNPTISMSLLNLTKNRVLNRIRDGQTKNWIYVLRR